MPLSKQSLYNPKLLKTSYKASVVDLCHLTTFFSFFGYVSYFFLFFLLFSSLRLHNEKCHSLLYVRLLVVSIYCMYLLVYAIFEYMSISILDKEVAVAGTQSIILQKRASPKL